MTQAHSFKHFGFSLFQSVQKCKHKLGCSFPLFLERITAVNANALSYTLACVLNILGRKSLPFERSRFTVS